MESSAEYQSLSVWAVAGFLCGLASLIVLVEPSLWFLAVLGVTVSTVALVRIARSEACLTGHRLALAGLGLSMAMGVASPANQLYYDQLVRQEAEQFGLQWFELLRHYQPEQAFELTKHPQARVQADTKSPKDLETFMTRGVVQKLLTLGSGARVRFERTIAQGQGADADWVTNQYQVEYNENGQTKSFSFVLTMVRLRIVEANSSSNRVVVAKWQIYRVEKL